MLVGESSEHIQFRHFKRTVSLYFVELCRRRNVSGESFIHELYFEQGAFLQETTGNQHGNAAVRVVVLLRKLLDIRVDAPGYIFRRPAERTEIDQHLLFFRREGFTDGLMVG